MALTNEHLENRLHQEYEELKRTIKNPNILVLGATGTGKSSLINSVFGRDLAETGSGLPVTENISRYAPEDASIVIFDTRGYEVGSDEQRRFLAEAIGYAKDSRQDQNPGNHIHIVWFCIQASGHRILDVDVRTVNMFVQLGIPTAMILTKSDLISNCEEAELKAVLEEQVPSVPVFMTSAMKLPSLGFLDVHSLSDWSMQQLPAGLRIAYLSAQKTSLDAKHKEAAAFIAQHVAGAFAVGFTPIPVADAPILVSNQMAMIARILYIYDLEYMLKSVQSLLAGLGAGKMISSMGIWTAGQLTKLIPGIGSITGGLINGAVAMAITAAIGQAISGICFRINELTINNDRQQLAAYLNNLEQNFQRLFAEQYSGK